mgnify:CR=1 FL=1
MMVKITEMMMFCERLGVTPKTAGRTITFAMVEMNNPMMMFTTDSIRLSSLDCCIGVAFLEQRAAPFFEPTGFIHVT